MATSSSYPSMLDFIFETMRENEGFIRSNAREVEDQAIILINDVIDYIPHLSELPDKEDYYARHAMAFFLLHVAMPFSYANYMNLLSGNLPGCFTGLRLVLESLAKCYLADIKYPKLAFFQKKLEALDQELWQNNQSIPKAMRNLGKDLYGG